MDAAVPLQLRNGGKGTSLELYLRSWAPTSAYRRARAAARQALALEAMRCRYALSETPDPARHHSLSFSRSSPSLPRFPPVHSWEIIKCYVLDFWSYGMLRLKYIMPLASRKTRWRTFTRRRSTCSQEQHRATTPGPRMYTCASAKRLIAPQCAHFPSAAVTSMANILLNSPAAALPST